MDLFETRTSYYDLLDWSDMPPDPLTDKGLILPDAATYNLSGGFGKMRFQGLPSSAGFTIWYNFYQILRTTRFITEALSSAIELNTMLCNAADHILFDHIHQSICANQFNLFYMPYIKNEVELHKGQQYATLDFHFELGYFEKLLEHYPNIIGPMLDKAYRGEGVSFMPAASFMNAELRSFEMYIIRMITKNIKDPYALNMAVELLLVTALQSRMPYKNMVLTPDEEENLIVANEKLMDDLSQFTSIKELSRIARMNSSKFKMLYKEKYTFSPKKYWNMFRMDKAVELILKGDRITDISNTLGFNNVSAFTRAYFFTYQMTPGETKRRAGIR